MSPRMKDITGMTFNRWTVLHIDKEWEKKDKRWICKCECGTIKPVFAMVLKSGNSTSCGCARSEMAKIRATTHGMTNSREQRTWNSMIQRCTNVNHVAFHNYGGRGITICPEWRNDFMSFFKDMGARPEGKSIDRIDNEKGYFKDNCKWSTEVEQKNNRQDNHLINWEGEIYTLSSLARKHGLTYNILHKRITAGKSLDVALKMPIRVFNRYHKPDSSTSI
jgi:hypothetical protein